LVGQKEEKAGSALQGNELPLDIILIEGSNQSYCYTSIMTYQLIRAYFDGRLEKFVGEILEERQAFLRERKNEM